MTDMWMVKSGENSIFIDDFKEYNLVSIGWNLGDLTNLSVDEITQLYENKYGNTNSLHQVLRFKNDIQIDDYVISLNKKTNTICLGRIISDYKWEEKITKVDSYGDHYFNVRSVEWLDEIKIDVFNQSTQGTLNRSQLTVFRINEDAKNDILKVFNGKIIQIRTVTLSKNDFDCSSYEDAVNFLSNVLINERNCHFHYIRRNINLIGRTLVLFKYNGRLQKEFSMMKRKNKLILIT